MRLCENRQLLPLTEGNASLRRRALAFAEGRRSGEGQNVATVLQNPRTPEINVETTWRRDAHLGRN